MLSRRAVVSDWDYFTAKWGGYNEYTKHTGDWDSLITQDIHGLKVVGYLLLKLNKVSINLQFSQQQQGIIML